MSFILPNCIFYRIQKTKKLEIEKGRQESWKRTPTFFFPSLFFSMNIYEDSLFFLFLSHCFLYRDKYNNQKKTRNWKGKAVVLDTYSFFLSLYILFFFEHLCRFSIIVFYPIAFCTGINTKTTNSKLKRAGVLEIYLFRVDFFSFIIFSLWKFSKITSCM